MADQASPNTQNHMLRTSEVSFRFTKKASRGSEPKSLVGESVVPHHLTTKRSHKTIVLCLSNAAVVSVFTTGISKGIYPRPTRWVAPGAPIALEGRLGIG